MMIGPVLAQVETLILPGCMGCRGRGVVPLGAREQAMASHATSALWQSTASPNTVLGLVRRVNGEFGASAPC